MRDNERDKRGNLQRTANQREGISFSDRRSLGDGLSDTLPQIVIEHETKIETGSVKRARACSFFSFLAFP